MKYATPMTVVVFFICFRGGGFTFARYLNIFLYASFSLKSEQWKLKLAEYHDGFRRFGRQRSILVLFFWVFF